MQIVMFPQWQELEMWLETNEHSRFNLWKWPIGAPSEDLHSEYCRTYFDYVDVWERICDGHANEDEQKAINKAVLFGREREQFSVTTLKSGKVLTNVQRKNRVELLLQPNAYTSDFWSALFFALTPQSVREICEAAKGFEIEDYKERFYAVRNRGFLFEECDEADSAEYFENFKSYHASWHESLAETARENCGLLVFGW